jgi:hypothetical protein
MSVSVFSRRSAAPELDVGDRMAELVGDRLRTWSSTWSAVMPRDRARRAGRVERTIATLPGGSMPVAG